jgi:hypothetical protein
MTDLKYILNELEQVNLAPIVIPALKLADPILGALPPGSMESIVSEQETRDRITGTVDKIAPILPDLIKFLGTVTQSYLTTSIIAIMALILTPILQLLAPILSKLVLKVIDPLLKLTLKLIPVLPPVIKVLNIVWMGEVLIEKGIRRILPG